MIKRELRFAEPLCVAEGSGFPPILATVDESLAAVATLPRSISDRVHWRFAIVMLEMISIGQTNDLPQARQALATALTTEGWLRTEPTEEPRVKWWGDPAL